MSSKGDASNAMATAKIHSRSLFFPILLGVWLIVSSSHAKAVEPMVAKLFMSRTEAEVVANFEELKAILISILESEDMHTTDNIIIAFYALLEVVKVQAISRIEMKSQIAELEQDIKK
jgi:hypothetical protein